MRSDKKVMVPNLFFIFYIQIFFAANVKTPIGCHDIYLKKDFYFALSSLITANIEVKRWIFKLDENSHNQNHNHSHSHSHSSGDNENRSWIAYLDVDK